MQTAELIGVVLKLDSINKALVYLGVRQDIIASLRKKPSVSAQAFLDPDLARSLGIKVSYSSDIEVAETQFPRVKIKFSKTADSCSLFQMSGVVKQGKVNLASLNIIQVEGGFTLTICKI